jgi:outer membrane receptor protein involved in Fe transport
VTLDVRNPSQVVRLSNACATPTVQPDCQDPSLFYSGIYDVLQGKSNRAVLRTYVDYAVTDQIKLFGDVSYVQGSGYGVFQPAFSSAAGGGTMPVTLKGDNAYLNGAGATAAALRTEWLAAGKTLTQGSTAQVGKFWQEFGGRDVKGEREQLKLLGGTNASWVTLGRDVDMEAYAQYSEVTGRTISYGVPNVLRVQQATDAILAPNGQIVCRDATARAAGCVPWDLVNGASREAINYANANATTEQTIKQTVAAINFSTEVFDLPAGPLGLAFGAEYRKEESEFVQDALSATGALFFNAIGTREGEYNVKEAYGELRVPILKDLPFAKELTVEVAGRLSDYSSIGSTDQYRVGITWAPFQDLRFRASEATAVRAPNIVELYSPQGRNFTTTALDPCDKDVFRAASAAQQAARRVTCAAAIPGYNPLTFTSNIGTGRPSLALLQGGNPDLGPETAHTYQYGVVFQPRWVPNLQMSLDFFKYNIADSIGTIPINTLFQALCYDDTRPYASNPFCANIVRDATGATTNTVGGVTEVILTNQNVASTKVEGYDASISYGFRTEDVMGKDYGDLALRLDGTWMYRFITQGLPGQAYTQFANTINNATPEWKAAGSVRWTYDQFSFTWKTIYYGSMISNNAVLPTALEHYYTGDYFRHDLRFTYKLNDDVTFRGGVDNLFNKKPPFIPETFLGTAASSQFDNAGRSYFIGANMQF